MATVNSICCARFANCSYCNASCILKEFVIHTSTCHWWLECGAIVKTDKCPHVRCACGQITTPDMCGCGDYKSKPCPKRHHAPKAQPHPSKNEKNKKI